MGQRTGFGGQSMSGALRSVILCTPRAAGWAEPSRSARWSALGYRGAPDAAGAESEHGRLAELLQGCGAEVLSLSPDERLSLDAVYTHDASLITDHGAVLMRMGKPARTNEPACHAELYRRLGIPILGSIEEPGTLEGGDIVWLDRSTLLVGRGYRSNGAGIAQLRALVGRRDVEVLEAPLPHGAGPAECLHLMSLMSMLAERTALVDLPLLAVETVEQLERRRFELIPIDPAERPTMAANVLALGGRRLLALADNRATNRRLEEHGFEIMSFAAGAVAHNGSGGPTCLTRPIHRE